MYLRFAVDERTVTLRTVIRHFCACEVYRVFPYLSVICRVMRWIPPLCENRRRENRRYSPVNPRPPHLGRMNALINYGRALRGDDWRNKVFSAPRAHIHVYITYVHPPLQCATSKRERIKIPIATTRAHLRTRLLAPRTRAV